MPYIIRNIHRDQIVTTHKVSLQTASTEHSAQSNLSRTEQSARTDLNPAMIMTCKESIYHDTICISLVGATDYGDEISLDSNERRMIGTAQKRRKCYYYGL